jgi:hypothetical protein
MELFKIFNAPPVKFAKLLIKLQWDEFEYDELYHIYKAPLKFAEFY